MSLNAILWALEQAPVDDPTTTLVLIALADNANADGTGSWPSVATLSTRARCSPRSVQRHLRILVDLGVIRPGNQAMVQGYRPDRRPVVYDLNLAAVRAQPAPAERGDNLAPRDGDGVTDATPRGDTHDVNGVTPMTPRGDTLVTQTVLEPNHEQSEEQSPLFPQPLRAVQSDGDWERFWNIYPRRIAKAAAKKAWDRAVKLADPDTIIAGAQRYADDPTRKPSYTAYPATWLNAGRWDDEGPSGTGTQGPTIAQGYTDHWKNGGGF